MIQIITQGSGYNGDQSVILTIQNRKMLRGYIILQDISYITVKQHKIRIPRYYMATN